MSEAAAMNRYIMGVAPTVSLPENICISSQCAGWFHRLNLTDVLRIDQAGCCQILVQTYK